jgi:hypothetical protein
VGDLKSNRKLLYKGRTVKASELAASLAADVRKPVKIGDKLQWYFTTTLRIPGIKHKVRIVVLGKERDDTEAVKYLLSNRVTWEVSRILGVYRHRWTGTETFHRDGKQQLGRAECQLRDDQGQTRHMHLLMLAYTLLMQQLRQGHAWEWAYQRLTTIGEACRAMLRETLRATLLWAMQHAVEDAWDVPQVLIGLHLLDEPCTL